MRGFRLTIFLSIIFPFLSTARTFSLQSSYLKVELSDAPFQLVISDHSSKVLMRTRASSGFCPFSYTKAQKQTAKEHIAWYSIKEKVLPWKCANFVSDVKKEGKVLEVSFSTHPSSAPELKLRMYFLNEKALSFRIIALKKPYPNRLKVSFCLFPEERFFGFGERFNSSNQYRSTVRVWTEEGGLGLGVFSRFFPNARWNPLPHGPDTTYLPVPFYLSNRNYGFLLENTEYSEFDLGESSPDALKITTWSSEFKAVIFYGSDPLDVIEQMSAYTGRIKLPPPWVFAPWNYAVGGSERVRQVARIVREHRIPNSAIWTEDWAGWGHIWRVNRRLYPDYEKLAQELKDMGFKFLGYFQPYIRPKDPLFKEAKEKGYLVVDEQGRPALFDVVFRKVAQIDLTNPKACRWWKEKIFAPALESGQDGWMADFSEYTPPWAVFADGRSGWEVHNQYPLLWAKINREFFDEKRPNGDYVFFMRAGFTASQRYTPVIWTGDQNTSWEKLDGIPSVIPAVLSAGISGFPIVATDIAGYHCLTCSPSDRELFYRWCQLGAMLPVMRNHEGYRFCHNWTFDRDLQTLMLYKKYAQLHTALFPYFYTLAEIAEKRGLPIIRHLFLHYPNDPKVINIDDEFLIGEKILVAPVVKKGAREREVYLPEGIWIDFWSGEKFVGKQTYKVSAPLEKIPIFVKNASIIPFFDAEIDTLVKENKSELKGWDDANKSMIISFWGRGEDRIKLYDRTEIFCSCSAVSMSKKGQVRIKRNKSSPPFVQVWLGPKSVSASFKGKEGVVELEGGGFSARCSVKGFYDRIYTIKIIY